MRYDEIKEKWEGLQEKQRLSLAVLDCFKSCVFKTYLDKKGNIKKSRLKFYMKQVKAFCLERIEGEGTFSIDFDDVKNAGYNSRNFPIEMLEIDYFSGGKYLAIARLRFKIEEKERVNYNIALGLKRQGEKKENEKIMETKRFKKASSLCVDFIKFLDEHNIEFYSTSARTNSLYVTICDTKLPPRYNEESYRFSDHRPGQSHTKFCLRTGETVRVTYDSIDMRTKKSVENAKEELLREINEYKKVKDNE